MILANLQGMAVENSSILVDYVRYLHCLLDLALQMCQTWKRSIPLFHVLCLSISRRLPHTRVFLQSLAFTYGPRNVESLEPLFLFQRQN